jgi:hypothetical protein
MNATSETGDSTRVMHHVGIVLASIDAEVSSYETTLNLRVINGPFIDPLQEARVIFLRGASRRSCHQVG